MNVRKIVMMNSLSLNLIHAEQEASKIIEKYGISSPEDIRLEDIAYDLGVNILEGELKGAAGSLVRIGDNATIRVSNDDSYEYRKRFSIAHELGHFSLNHGISIQRICSDEDMMNWYKKNEETEANFFAGELILPESLIKKKCDVAEVDFRPIKQIAQEFKASLTATAIRFVRFCPERCAVVFSKDSRVKWFYKSDDWDAFIPIGSKLDERTSAFSFFKGDKLPEEPIEVDADAWVDGDGLEEIVEHSVGSKYLNFVLSILWIEP
jgi:Zn-dependent peptidase ImmA (M78 family)